MLQRKFKFIELSLVNFLGFVQDVELFFLVDTMKIPIYVVVETPFEASQKSYEFNAEFSSFNLDVC